MKSKSSSECSIDQEICSYSINGKIRISEGATRTAKSRANHCALANFRLFKQVSDCAYYWKDNKRMHVALEILNNNNEMLKFEKVNSVRRETITDDENNF